MEEPKPEEVKDEGNETEEKAEESAPAPVPVEATPTATTTESATTAIPAAATTATESAPAPASVPAVDSAPTPSLAVAPAAAAAAAEGIPPTGLPPGVPLPGTPAAPATANPYTATALPPVAAAAEPQMVEEKGEVSSMYVGRVIGKGGEMIRDLQARSGARIDVDQSVPPGQPRIITYRGTRETVDFAKHLVNLLCHEHVDEANLPLGQAKREVIAVPATSVGKIIGRGGEMIRELQSRSHAKIQIDHHGTAMGVDNKSVTITGTEQSVTKAKEMVMFLVANPMMDAMQGLNMLMEDKLHKGGQWGSGPPYLNMPNMGQGMMPHMVGNPYGAPAAAAAGYDQTAYGAAAGAYGQAPPAYGAAAPQQGYGAPPAAYGAAAGGAEMFMVAKTYMGRIIGQKGVTINDLQKRSGCDIQINQDVPHGQDCEISIRGSPQGIQMAKQMLQEIIETGPNHPYAGGARKYSVQDLFGWLVVLFALCDFLIFCLPALLPNSRSCLWWRLRPARRLRWRLSATSIRWLSATGSTTSLRPTSRLWRWISAAGVRAATSVRWLSAACATRLRSTATPSCCKSLEECPSSRWSNLLLQRKDW